MRKSDDDVTPWSRREKQPAQLEEKLPPFHTLKQFGEEFIGEMDSRLMDGESAMKVAGWIQQHKKLLVDVQQTSLKRMLDRYRSRELRQKTFQRIATAQKHHGLGFVAHRINAMAQLEELALTQKGRLLKILKLEDGKPMVIGAVSDELKLYKDLLVNLAHVQLETGVLQRVSRTVKGTIVDATGEVRKFTWTDEQDELLKDIIENGLGQFQAA